MPGPSTPAAPATDLLDEVLPRYEAREVHGIFVAAPAGDVYRALEGLTLDELPLFRALMGVRALPARLARSRRRRARVHGTAPARGAARRPARGQGARDRHPVRLLDGGLRPFALLAERPGAELVIGALGQPWRLAGGELRTVGGLADFHAFDRPGFAKLALGFKLEPVDGGTRVVTETRVDTTDPLAHRRFGPYWRVIRLGSGAIRRSWLRAVKRRAERSRVSAAPTR
jgi:hypothetical protein